MSRTVCRYIVVFKITVAKPSEMGTIAENDIYQHYLLTREELHQVQHMDVCDMTDEDVWISYLYCQAKLAKKEDVQMIAMIQKHQSAKYTYEYLVQVSQNPIINILCRIFWVYENIQEDLIYDERASKTEYKNGVLDCIDEYNSESDPVRYLHLPSVAEVLSVVESGDTEVESYLRDHYEDFFYTVEILYTRYNYAKIVKAVKVALSD